MEKNESSIRAQATLQTLRHELSRFGQSRLSACWWQLANTLLPYFALWALMVYLLRSGYSYAVIIAPLLLASLFLIRIFIFFHDCTHGSFFSSFTANRFLGYLTGFITFTAYEAWRQPHNIHHGSYADLDHRGIGDIWTLTTDEYRAMPPGKRLLYRLYRHPLIMLGLGPFILFFIGQRLPKKGFGPQERNSVIILNLVLVLWLLIMSETIGLGVYLMIQIPLTMISGALGVWLFYVQHQFEGVYWMRHAEWDPMRAAFEGSSYYRLPAVMQWFTGSIGLHYIHHILPRIPNYRLQETYDANPVLRTVQPQTFLKSLSFIHLNLWDVAQHKLVSFRSLKSSCPAE
jgi:omega-6 fatty acid desaturase (delta-12 desaturase)